MYRETPFTGSQARVNWLLANRATVRKLTGRDCAPKWSFAEWE